MWGLISFFFFFFSELKALEEYDTHGVVPTEQSRIELEQKVEEAKENIRKAEVCLEGQCRPFWLWFYLVKFYILKSDKY